MALPPTIPTSFVPHSAIGPRRFRTDLTGAFSIFAYAMFILAFLLSLGVFLYDRVLVSRQAAKDAELASKVSKIEQATVEDFIRLRNRLTSSKTLINGHTAFSSLFSSLEKIIPATVRFSSLDLTLDAAVPKMKAAGTAKNFNALASASMTFGADARFKDAIFSGITINKDSSVSFSFAATLDPKIIVFSP